MVDFIQKYYKYIICLLVGLIIGFAATIFVSHQDVINSISQKIDSSASGLSVQIQNTAGDVKTIKEDIGSVNATVGNIDTKVTDVQNKTTNIWAAFQNTQKTTFLFVSIEMAVTSIILSFLVPIGLAFSLKIFPITNNIKIITDRMSILIGFFVGVILTILIWYILPM